MHVHILFQVGLFLLGTINNLPYVIVTSAANTIAERCRKFCDLLILSHDLNIYCILNYWSHIKRFNFFSFKAFSWELNVDVDLVMRVLVTVCTVHIIVKTILTCKHMTGIWKKFIFDTNLSCLVTVWFQFWWEELDRSGVWCQCCTVCYCQK